MTRAFKHTVVFIALCLVCWCIGAYVLISFPKGYFELILNHHANATLDFVFSYITYMGDGAFQVALLLIVLGIRKYRRYFWPGLISFLLTAIVSYVYKYVIYDSEPRPVVFFKSETLHLATNVIINHQHSFPSGHTLTAFSWALWLCIVFKNKYIQLTMFLLATAVAFSRVYLMQHFVEDVFAGSIMGVLCTYAAFGMYNTILKNRTSKSGN